jgi:hypothetical protein
MGGVGGPGGGMLPNTGSIQPEGAATGGLLAGIGLMLAAAATRLTLRKLPVRRR